MHVQHARWFSGRLDPESVDAIAELVRRTGAARLVDFGSGKGFQYLADRVHERWGGILPHCYDVGIEQLDRRPEGRFDGLICTDVLEHIFIADVERTLDEMFAMLRSDGGPAFAYFNIYCNTSGKTFEDGQSVHLTVRPPSWWHKVVMRRQRRGLIVYIDYQYSRGDDLQRGDLEGVRPSDG